MTTVSLTQACHHLGIDAKTLHRWLAEAQLPLPHDPCDGRKKGVSQQHLLLLARLHQRTLTPSHQEQAAPVPDALSPLPAALLTLSEQIVALQVQVTSLQQRVDALTLLLEHRFPPPAAPPQKTRTRPAALTPPTPRPRPAANVPAKPVHVIPRVEYGGEGRYVVICPKRGVLPFEPDTPEWFAWVAEQSSFRFVGKEGHFSAHHEWRVPKGAWRANRHIRNHGHTLRLAPSHELTIAVLEQAAATLQAHLK